MPKYYAGGAYHPILFNLKRCNLGKTDLCKAINVTDDTLKGWINNPFMIPMGKVVMMAGLFGVPAEELFYCLIRNKPQLPKSGKWYLEEIKLKLKEKEKDL